MAQNEIKFYRGDSQKILFKLKNGETDYLLGEDDKLYMTVKNLSSILFQKTLDNGISYDAESEYYSIAIASSDTCEANPGMYPFDIELVRDFSSSKNTKTLICGTLTLVEDVTLRGDES